MLITQVLLPTVAPLVRGENLNFYPSTFLSFMIYSRGHRIWPVWHKKAKNLFIDVIVALKSAYFVYWSSASTW